MWILDGSIRKLHNWFKRYKEEKSFTYKEASGIIVQKVKTFDPFHFYCSGSYKISI